MISAIYRAQGSNSYFNKKIFSDITVTVGERKIRAHKAILVKNSMWFRNELERTPAKSNITVHLLPSDEEPFKTMLECFYDEDVMAYDNEEDDNNRKYDMMHLKRLVNLARQYQATKVEAAVAGFLAKRLNGLLWHADDAVTLIEALQDVTPNLLKPHYEVMARLASSWEFLPVLDMPVFHELLRMHPELAVGFMAAMKNEQCARTRFDAFKCSGCGFIGAMREHRERWALARTGDKDEKRCPMCEESSSMKKW
ncbi:Hypothetical protein D9617_3g021460 [Elsinoe fawcettii]|nr:Hypothetical protein D9617_3g021460 [Elsinoe fawcettii]